MTVATAIKDKPIIFSSPMVRAIPEGRKTMTRRVMKPQPDERYHSPAKVNDDGWWAFHKPNQGTPPFGIKEPYQVGQKLWVRETWQYSTESGPCIYQADEPVLPQSWMTWNPSIFMPRWASRITLEVTNIRAERLQEITEEDAIAEGARYMPQRSSYKAELAAVKSAEEHARHPLKPPLGDLLTTRFLRYWDTLHAKPKPVKSDGKIIHYVSYPWEDIQEVRTYRGKPWYVYGNPWVWVVGFKQVS